MVGGIIAGVALDGIVKGAVWPESSQLHILSIPNDVGVGKITNIKFITFNDSGVVGNVNITLEGAASERGKTDGEGMLVLPANVTSNGSIRVIADKSGYWNVTASIKATAGLDVSASPGSVTSGTATYVTMSVYSVGKPVENAAVNLSGAGIAVDGVTTSNGQIVLLVNAPGTGKITASAWKADYAPGSTIITSTAQQVLSVSQSHSALTVNVPVYVTFTVTAGGSPVNDAKVSLSGAASGNGMTNKEGRAVIQVTPQTTGTITVSANATGYSDGTNTITSSSTQSLSMAIEPTTITAGIPTYVKFTLISGNNAVSEANIALTGVATGNGITNQNGEVILLVNPSGTGTITASATRPGYSGATITFAAIGRPTLSVSASPSNITNGVPTYVTFTVASGGSAVSGATVSVSGGGISADGMTNSAGQVTIQLNSAGTGTINVAARKSGYIDGSMTLAH